MGCRGVLPVALALVVGGCVGETRFLGEKLPATCAQTSAVETCAGWIRDRVMLATALHVYDDPDAVGYVRGVAEKIRRANAIAEPITVRVIDDPMPQAYANIGRVIYVDRGALAVLRDEAELAALLAHEIGHVVAAHEHEAFVDAARSGGDDDDARHLRDERDDELQADELAVRLVGRAGYDPSAVERMLRALGASAPDPEDPSKSRHPRWLERIAHVQALVAALPPAARTGARDEAAFRHYLAHLVVGADPLRAYLVTTAPAPAPHVVPPQAAVFARAGLAVDLGVAHGDEASIEDGAIVVYYAADRSAVDLRLVPTAFAGFYAPDADLAVAKHAHGATTLVISGKGDAAAHHVHALAAHVRAVAPLERAQLHPQYAEFGPRVLWSQPGQDRVAE